MKYSLLKRISAFVLAFALVMTTAFNAVGTTQANAAKKATVSAKGATVTVGASKNIKVSIKCKAKAKATIKVAVVKGATGKVTKKVTNSNAKKAAKTCKSTIKVTGKKAGKVKLSITPYINGKKAGKAKKITVTVKAKKTDVEPTPVTPSSDASKDPVPVVPSVESLNVTASNGTTIGETEQTILSVTSGTQGGVLINDSITFESKNPAILSVDSKGVVTGLKAGQANVLVSAKDSNGKTITAEVAITVEELKDATITVPDAQKSMTILVGKSVKLTPSVNPATYADKLIYESSKPELVEVSADGTVTAKAAADEVTITIKAKGTKGNASVKVKSVANGYGIASFEAVKADTFGVGLTTPVSAEDFGKLKFAVKLTTDIDIVASMDAKGNITLKAKNGELEKGVYTLTISSSSLVIDETTATKSTEVFTRAAKTVKITNQAVYAPSDSIKVEYEVDDQYGDKMTGYLADKLTWTLSYKDSTINTAYAFPIGAIKTGDTYNDGFVTLSIGGSDWYAVNLTNFFLNNPTGQADFTITAYVVGDQKVNGSSTFGVKKLRVDEVSILGLASAEAAAPNKDVLRKFNSNATYFLKLAGKDENGAAVDWVAYQNGGYSNSVIISANNASLCTLYTEGTSDDYTYYNGGYTTPGNPDTYVQPTAKRNGLFPVIIKAGQTGKVTFSAIASVAKPTEKSNDSWELEVKDTAKASYLVWPTNVTCAIGGDTTVDLKFLDQDKKPVDDPKCALADAGFTVNLLLGNSDSLVGGDDVPTGVRYEDGKYILHINGNRTGTEASVSINNGTFISDAGKVTVTSKAKASKFVTNAKESYNVVNGEKVTFDVWANDQYDKLWKGALFYTITAGGATSAFTAVGTDFAAVESPSAADVTDGDPDEAVVGELPDGDGKGATGVRISLAGNEFGSGTVTVKLYSEADSSKNIGSGVKVTINTTETPDYFVGTVTNTDQKAVAGENVNIKLTGYTIVDDDANEAGVQSTEPGNDTIATKFNGSAKVTIVEDIDGNNTAWSAGISTTVDATFKDGVATVAIPSKVATVDGKKSEYRCLVKLGNDKLYGKFGSAPSAGLTNADGVVALATVTVGAPKRIAVTRCEVNATITFTLKDSMGNPINLTDRDIRVAATDASGAKVDLGSAFTAVDATTGQMTVGTTRPTAEIQGGKVTITDQASGVSATVDVARASS